MTKKIIPLLILIIVHGIAGAHEEQDKESYINIIDVINEIFNFIVEQLVIIVRKFTEFETAIKNVASEVIDTTKKPLQDVAENAMKRMNEIADTFGELTGDRKLCLADSTLTLESLPAQQLKDLGTCVQSKLDKVRDIKDKTVLQIMGVPAIVLSLLQEMEKCQKNTTCVNEVINKGFGQMSDVVFEIAFQGIQMQLVFPKTIPEIKTCGTNQIDEITMLSKDIVLECFKGAASRLSISILLIFQMYFVSIIVYVSSKVLK